MPCFWTSKPTQLTGHQSCTTAPSPGLLLASHSRFRIRQHPRVPPRPRRACPPGMSRPPCSSFHCSSRLVSWLLLACCVSLSVPACLPAFLSFPFLSFAWAFLPPEERCSLPRLRVRPTVRSSPRRIPAVGFKRNSIFLSQLASLAIGRPSPRHVHRTAVGSAARVASWYPAVALAEVPYSSAKALALNQSHQPPLNPSLLHPMNKQPHRTPYTVFIYIYRLYGV
jgi:hypothetical protein